MPPPMGIGERSGRRRWPRDRSTFPPGRSPRRRGWPPTASRALRRQDDARALRAGHGTSRPRRFGGVGRAISGFVGNEFRRCARCTRDGGATFLRSSPPGASFRQLMGVNSRNAEARAISCGLASQAGRSQAAAAHFGWPVEARAARPQTTPQSKLAAHGKHYGRRAWRHGRSSLRQAPPSEP